MHRYFQRWTRAGVFKKLWKSGRKNTLYRYRDPDSVAGKAVALLRHGLGGHPLHRAPVKALEP